MIIWVSKYAKYIDVNITKGDYRYIIECKDDYITEEFKTILNELNINFNFTENCIMISFNEIVDINIFIDKCKDIINHKYQIEKIKKELTDLKK